MRSLTHETAQTSSLQAAAQMQTQSGPGVRDTGVWGGRGGGPGHLKMEEEARF